MSKMKNIPVHSTDRFTFDKATSTFVAFVSDLPSPRFSAIYDDACDYGFVMRSAKTGTEVVFTMVDEQYNEDNELQVSLFRSADGKFGCSIFND